MREAHRVRAAVLQALNLEALQHVVLWHTGIGCWEVECRVRTACGPLSCRHSIWKHCST